MTLHRHDPRGRRRGATADWYTADRERFGYLPNYTKVFGHRPAVYAEKFLGPETTRAVADGDAITVLDPVDAEIVRFATLVTRDAAAVTAKDVDRLRAVGLSDEDILDVTLAVAARCFFSTVLEALGVQPDPAFQALDPDLRAALTVGRPIAEA